MIFSPRFEQAHRPASLRLIEGPAPAILLIGGARTRTAYRTILAQANYELFDADTGEYGVELARKIQPGLIVVELCMPGRDGWEVLRFLKADSATYMIPVVAASLTKLPGGTYHRARSAGFVDLVTRPIERRHVLELARTWSRPPAQLIV